MSPNTFLASKFSFGLKFKTYHGDKSEVLDCFVPKDLDNLRPNTTAAVLDGAVLIQMLRPRNAVTLGDYYIKEFVPYILS